MLRNVVRYLARGRSIRRSFPAHFGRRRIWLSPDSQLQYLAWDWARRSRELLDVAAQDVRLDDTVWDVGANVGVFAFAAAHHVGPRGVVVAIEPDPFLATLLQRSALDPTNADRRVHVLCAAAGDAGGVGRFLVSNDGRATNTLAAAANWRPLTSVRYDQYVPLLTLDSLLEVFAPPRFVKIDVEGAEVMALEGARRVLEVCRPRLYIEIGEECSERATEILRSNRYRLYSGDRTGREIERCEFNTLAVPEEQAP